eukprot:gnl/Dysnectes_brevis/1898_a2180_2444.p1 GENE.gnl/Dysnectes_brevis/1898_a2180_2444~~gnl/Dysnectes_brevis/1898_a2180_2444.p1  ORF type:complete len:200 (+),score=31.58 gnl/Dysnectes_brevis/1898_a2180_2444:64-663(+)
MQRYPVVFVLGGPGAGKGTQCQKLSESYPIRHFSAGDLLRAEMKKTDSPDKKLIDHYIREGLIVPAEITVKLLKNAMTSDTQSRLFLIDGFPRAIDQWECFQKIIGDCLFMLFLECKDEVLCARLSVRRESSGRTDDNEESIKKRLRVFHDQTMAVKEHFRSIDRLVTVNSEECVATVFKDVSEAIEIALAEPLCCPDQ